MSSITIWHEDVAAYSVYWHRLTFHHFADLRINQRQIFHAARLTESRTRRRVELFAIRSVFARSLGARRSRSLVLRRWYIIQYRQLFSAFIDRRWFLGRPRRGAAAVPRLRDASASKIRRYCRRRYTFVFIGLSFRCCRQFSRTRISARGRCRSPTRFNYWTFLLTITVENNKSVKEK